MVITLYADRRSHELADFASRLAHALAPFVAQRPIALVGLHVPLDVVPDGETGVSHFEVDSAREVGGYLRELATRFAATIVAMAGAPNEQVLSALDVSDRIVLVSDPSVSSIRATQRTLKLCTSIGYGSEKVAVVLHDFTDDAPLAPADAAMALKRAILGVIPGPAVDPAVRKAAFAQLAMQLAASLPAD